MSWVRKDKTHLTSFCHWFDVKLKISKYTDEDYELLIKDINLDWSKEETDFLWESM